MKSIFGFFAQRHILASLVTIMILVLGLNTLIGIKRSIYPHADLGVMNVLTRYPGASPEDVELNVTNKIEETLKDISGIDHIVSISMENISTVDIYINLDAENQQKIKDDIRRAVSRVTDLPVEVDGTPLVTEMNTAEIDVIEVGLTGDVPYGRLREQARLFEKKLKNIPGVVRTDRFGYRAREVRVEVLPDSMAEYQVSLHEIMAAIRSRNIQGSSGTFESYTRERDLVTMAQLRHPQQVGDVIVRSSFDGPLVRVSDLATIRDGFEEERLLSRLNGRPAISFLVFLNEYADVIRTCDEIKILIDKERAQLPDDMEIDYVNDESRYVRNSFKVVLNNGLIGLALVLLVLPIFLNIRTAFWVAVGIPVSLLGTVFLLPVFGQHLDTVGLTGMILVLGIIVDDAIIISENITKHREMGAKPLDAVVDGLGEVFWPVVTTVLTTVIVFIPMFFMPGVLGASIIPIPLAIILALTISLIESTIALPAHLLPGINRFKMKKSGKSQILRLGDFYTRFLDVLLKGRYVIVLLFACILGLSVWYVAKNMNFVLFPTGTSEHVFINSVFPAGTPMQVTSEKTAELERIVADLPEEELDSFSARIGLNPSTGGMHGAESQNYATISLNLTPFTERKRSTDVIVEELREKMNRLTDQGEITFSIVGTSPPVGKPISLIVAGADDRLRKDLADSVHIFLQQMAGVKDITRDDKAGKEQVEIKMDYEKLARLGLTVADVAQTVRIAYDGEVVTSVRYGDEDVDFRLMMSKRSRRRLADLNDLQIPNDRGRLISLGEVASFFARPGFADYRHYDGDRAITIEADVDQELITPMEVTDRVYHRFDLNRDWPGMSIELGGELFETERSMAALMRAFIIALIGVYFLLVLLFDSLTQPFLVMVAIPFGIVGVIAAFAFHGESFSFMSVLGIIGLCGVVVNDSLVLVDHINDLKGRFPRDSLRKIVARGTADRLRPVLLTTITTVVAILPLAYGLGGSSPFIAPLALALGWGLFFATPLSLVLVPSLFLIREDIQRLFRRCIDLRGDIPQPSITVE